jgi:hypothetical protein
MIAKEDLTGLVPPKAKLTYDTLVLLNKLPGLTYIKNPVSFLFKLIESKYEESCKIQVIYRDAI